jgi:hypothetical protein
VAGCEHHLCGGDWQAANFQLFHYEPEFTLFGAFKQNPVIGGTDGRSQVLALLAQRCFGIRLGQPVCSG